MNIRHILPILTVATLFVLPSCFGDNEDINYSDWRDLNSRAFNDSMYLTDEKGELVYSSLTPTWDNSFTVLLKWHNDRKENTNRINPLSTSTCVIKYTLTNVNGDTLDSSASFTCVPNNLVTGFMAALTNMETNDTVTAIIPYTAGYGAYGYGSVLPYSTLVFGIRLDSISKLM